MNSLFILLFVNELSFKNPDAAKTIFFKNIVIFLILLFNVLPLLLLIFLRVVGIEKSFIQ